MSDSTSVIAPTQTDVVVNGKNPTIEYGMELLTCNPRASTAILSKQVGLQLVLLGMSELQSKRIANLAVAAYELEQKLYSPEIIQTLDSKKLLSTYQAVSQALQEALSYVNTTQSMDWTGIDSKLKQLLDSDPDRDKHIDPEAEESQRTISKAARELLEMATSRQTE